MASTQKSYFIFEEGEDLMFVLSTSPDNLNDAMIASIIVEIKSRDFDGPVAPDIVDILREAGQGIVLCIGGPTFEVEEEEEEEDEEPGIPPLPEIHPFEIEIRNDNMAADLVVMHPVEKLYEDWVMEVLEESGIVQGVIDENIATFIEEWPKKLKIPLALGTAPENGTDAVLEMAIEIKDNLAPKFNNEGGVDFKQLDLIESVEKGAILQTRTPPTPGTDGVDIYGKVVKATPGKDKALGRGTNTAPNEDGTKLISNDDGFIYIGPGGSIHIKPVYTVRGDVDYSTGNVEYKGDIIVSGDIRAGFKVKAGADVFVRGAVEDSVVEAKGSITINGGVVSSGKAVVMAGNDVNIGFAQNAIIRAGGSVNIRKESIGSQIQAKKNVEVKQKNGRIIGGQLDVGGWLVTNVLGSEIGPILQIRFYGKPASEKGVVRSYEGCFASAKSVISPIEIRFGHIVSKIAGTNNPVTVSVTEKKVIVEDRFITENELVKIRREEALMKAKELL